MTNNPDDEDQLAEVFRIASLLDKDIPIHWVAGNYDAGDAPTPETLSRYRQRYGNDNYSFNHEGSHFIIINSCVCFYPSNIPHEWETLVEFLRKDLQLARDLGCQNIVVFMHHALFLSSPEEGDGYFVVPRERRRILLEMLNSHRVSAVFAGHCHKNLYATDGCLQMVTTGAAGYPLGEDPPGLRVVRMCGGIIEQNYYGLDDLPGSVALYTESP
jgi:serine/threonine-protein phosphatase CPPED1